MTVVVGGVGESLNSGGSEDVGRVSTESLRSGVRLIGFLFV